MTSTTAESSESAQLRTEIERLFSWNPPRLIPDTGQVYRAGTTTAGTRKPSFYDKHFGAGLVLKRVVRFPSLIQQLAKNVDKALDAASSTLPPLAHRFITAYERELFVEALGREVQDEKGVVNFYDKTTAVFCAYVASTLILHPTAPQWLPGLLEWTQSPGRFSGYAIMDGRLRFKSSQAPAAVALVETIESKYLDVFKDIRKSDCSLATWEIKSISVGSAEVMTEVPILGTFSWTTCKDKRCAIDPKHIKSKKNANNTKVGPDAQNPPWNLSNLGDETNIQPLATLQQPVTGRVTRSAARSRQPPQLTPRSSDGGPSTKDKGKKRELEPEGGEDEAYLATRLAARSRRPLASEGGPSTKDKGKKRKLEPEEDENEDEAYPARPVLTAQSLVQQAWAQAVRVDGTIIVLHSGNHELVCIRHRATQTLYVSNIVEPPDCVDPGYGKLHIGIYIAAIQETIDRQLQLKQNPPGDDDGGGGGSTGGDKDQDRNRGSGSGRKDVHSRRGRRGGGSGDQRGSGRGVGKSGRAQGSAGRKGPSDDGPVAIEKAIYVANNHNRVLLYLQYGIYDSPVPASFIRSAPPITARAGSPTPFSPRAIQIVLTSEIGRGATGVVHRGVLELDVRNSTTVELDVVVKLAFDADQREALKNEYEIYRHLRSKGIRRGIATTLGIFDDLEDAACALVMLYAGVPLCQESQCNLSISDRESALSTLKSIHHAGILHGDIRRANILIGDSGITIVDFGHSMECGNQRGKNQEYAILRDVLGLACKSQ